MERIICRSKYIIVCIFMLSAAGCNTAGYPSEGHKEAEENITEVTVASPKEEPEQDKEEPEEGKEEQEGKAEEKDRLEKEDLDGNGLKEAKESFDVISEQAEEETVIVNPYFPGKKHVALQVHVEYHNGTEFVDETAGAEINRVKICEEGSIYKLTIYITPFMSSWYFPLNDIMNIYLYVTADRIYRILPYAQLESGGATVDFYDNDELLIETLDTDEKLQENGVIVCQEEELQGNFFSITQKENRITYYLSETDESGELAQKDLFVWEKEKGLIEFGTGFGPGPMDVHIDEICEVIEDE